VVPPQQAAEVQQTVAAGQGGPQAPLQGLQDKQQEEQRVLIERQQAEQQELQQRQQAQLQELRRRQELQQQVAAMEQELAAIEQQNQELRARLQQRNAELGLLGTLAQAAGAQEVAATVQQALDQHTAYMDARNLLRVSVLCCPHHTCSSLFQLLIWHSQGSVHVHSHGAGILACHEYMPCPGNTCMAARLHMPVKHILATWAHANQMPCCCCMYNIARALHWPS
jgi:hypothetical protein